MAGSVPKPQKAAKNRAAPLDLEATLWAADELRGNLDFGTHEHVALGLIFLKHNSDAPPATTPAFAHNVND